MATIIDLDLTNSHNDTSNPCSCGSCSNNDISNGFVEPKIIMHLPDSLLSSSIKLLFTKPDSTTLETSERIIDTTTKTCSYSMPFSLFSAVGTVTMTITAEQDSEVLYQSSLVNFKILEQLTSSDCVYISLVDYSVTPHEFNVSKCIRDNGVVVSDLDNLFKDASYSEASGNLTFTRYNDTTKVLNIGGSSDWVDKVYPVGSIYMSVNSTDPASLFGGTWEQLKDRFLLGAGDTYANGATGGEATHTLTINEMPAHSHGINNPHTSTGANEVMVPTTSGTAARWAESYSWNPTTNTGGSQPHNNMPPYLAVYMWKRVA